MKLRNDAMEEMIEQLVPFIDRRDSVGYAAGRNMRYLRDGCMDWLQRKAEAIARYGQPVVDEDGKETGQYEIKPDCDQFEEFVSELMPIAGMEHDVKIFKLPIDKAEGVLSGRELDTLYWMFDEKGAGGDE